MPRPRKSQISIEATPYYHCVSRCVRRAFLCGKDRFTGRSFEHRRQLIEDELLKLADIFFIDLAAYSVMSNHYHVVFFLNKDEYSAASSKDIVARWHRIHQGTDVSARYLKGESLDPGEKILLDQQIATWTDRLFSISWFMRVINEKIARMANSEDEVTGRFWEGRFKCQALLDEKALLSCMAYVDLNPVRAGMAETPECSVHTSVKQRVESFTSACNTPNLPSAAPEVYPLQPRNIQAFVGNPREGMPSAIAFNLVDYLELVDWTGRQIREDKVGNIDPTAEPILQRLSISPAHWVYLCTHFESSFKGLVGSVEAMKESLRHLGRKRARGCGVSSKLFV